MSSSPYTPVGGDQVGQLPYEEYEDSHGQGLVTFAGVMLLIAGVLNVLYGIAAIDNANVFTKNARYVFADLNTWGWFVLVLGVVQLFAAFAIWRGTPGPAGSASPPRASTRSSRRCSSRRIRSSR